MNIRKCCYICKHQYFYVYIFVSDMCRYDKHNEKQIKDVYNHICKHFEIKNEFKRKNKIKVEI